MMLFLKIAENKHMYEFLCTKIPDKYKKEAKKGLYNIHIKK